ncbi:MAG TPA: hypothetical protein VE444_00965 [Gaiellaceae bacterium]|jgi:hypothetical protein|nr:hypothetical protein [Gaiellaceae bacterium]
MKRLATAFAVLALAACGGGNGDDDGVGDTGPPTGPAPTGTIDDTTETDDGY